jgi:hypothetical protein
MNLFIDTISNEACVILFGSDKEIVDKIVWDIK